MIRYEVLNFSFLVMKVGTASIPVGELDTSIISVSISIPCIKIAISRITTRIKIWLGFKKIRWHKV